MWLNLLLFFMFPAYAETAYEKYPTAYGLELGR